MQVYVQKSTSDDLARRLVGRQRRRVEPRRCTAEDTEVAFNREPERVRASSEAPRDWRRDTGRSAPMAPDQDRSKRNPLTPTHEPLRSIRDASERGGDQCASENGRNAARSSAPNNLGLLPDAAGVRARPCRSRGNRSGSCRRAGPTSPGAGTRVRPRTPVIPHGKRNLSVFCTDAMVGLCPRFSPSTGVPRRSAVFVSQ